MRPLGATESRLVASLTACEHVFVTGPAQRPRSLPTGIERRALWLAEDAARDRRPSLADALQLIHLSTDRGSAKYERAAMRWPSRSCRRP